MPKSTKANCDKFIECRACILGFIIELRRGNFWPGIWFYYVDPNYDNCEEDVSSYGISYLFGYERVRTGKLIITILTVINGCLL